MRVLVLGAGVIGVTTAYFLGARGYEVEVLERGGSAGCETSFANGGQLSFSHAEPWANPHVLPKVFKWMFQDDAPLVLRPRADWQMIRWGLKFLANCTTQAAHRNTVNTLRLGIYSKKKMEQLRVMSGVQFDSVRDGILHIFSKQADYDHAIEQAHYQEKFGCKEDILSTKQCIQMEPALEHVGKPIVGGIHAPLDESGDACSFSIELTKVCEREFKTKFTYSTNIERLLTEKGRITGVKTDKGIVTADMYVMSLGSYSPIYLRQIGIDVPIYPMKGYSVTFPTNIHSPKMSITDSEAKLVYSRLGNRLRVAGTAEFAGYNRDVTPHRVEAIRRQVRELFPKVETNYTHEWACLRPSTPDGPPIIGKTKYDNLLLNTGHGTLGWTHAAGSGVLLADILENRPTEISLSGLTADRY